MKLLRIFLFCMLLISTVPFDGFCFDEGIDHDEQCASACHIICCQSGILLMDTSAQLPTELAFLMVSFSNRSHQSPHIAVERRPPIAY